MYSYGCTDRAMVMRIQRFLKITVDGVFGNRTLEAVKRFQSINNLVADGVVGRETLAAMGILDTDLKGQLHFVTPEGLVIQKHHLPVGEYIQESDPVFNEYLVLHHTGGWNNPFGTVDGWGKDQRGAIATEFVIGGQRVTNGDDEYDGVVVQAFPTGCRGWHVASDYSMYLNKHSVGIELCNFGNLTADGKTYVGGKAIDSQISVLDEPFSGYQQHHRYSDKQLYSLKRLILYVASRDSIDIRKGLIDWILKEGPIKAFDFHREAAEGKVKGMLVHANVVQDKVDLFPQKELVDMLLSL